MRKQADALKVCPIPDACLLVMAQRPYRLLGLPETRSLIFLIKNSPDQAEGYLDYLHPQSFPFFSLGCRSDAKIGNMYSNVASFLRDTEIDSASVCCQVWLN
jgi:hypothetical protein